MISRRELDSIRNFVGRRIRFLRVGRGMTQEKLAELSGLHPTYIGQLERGEKNASVECISCVVKAFNMSLQAFFQDAEKVYVPSDKPILKLFDTIARLSPKEQDELCEIIRRILAFRERRRVEHD